AATPSSSTQRRFELGVDPTSEHALDRSSAAAANQPQQPERGEPEQRPAERPGVLDRTSAAADAELIVRARIVARAAVVIVAALALALVPLVEQRVDLLGLVDQVHERRGLGHALLIDVLVPRHLVLELG